MANKRDVINAFYNGIHVVISANRFELENATMNVDSAVLNDFIGWLDETGEDDDLKIMLETINQ